MEFRPVLAVFLLLICATNGCAAHWVHGTGVITASAAVQVAPSTDRSPPRGTVLFPIPSLTGHQVPLDFSVSVEPPENLRGVRWIERGDGRNLLAEVTLVASDEPTTVRWFAQVLVEDTPRRQLPPFDAPEVNDENRAWLRSTACVQCDDPDVAAKAAALAAARPDFAAYIRAATDFVAGNQGDGGEFRSLDAAVALHCGGSCTSRANLLAALLRARGIPARTQAHLPIWSGPLYEHWLVEYWHPGAGWIWIESSLGTLQPSAGSLVTINTANPEDEDESFSPALTHSNVARGAPRWSVHELSPELERFHTKTDNWARVACELTDDPAVSAALFAAARDRFAELCAGWVAGEPPERDAVALSAALKDASPEALLEWLE